MNQYPAVGLCRLVHDVAAKKEQVGMNMLFAPENVQIMDQGFDDVAFFASAVDPEGLVAILCCGDLYRALSGNEDCLYALKAFRDAVFRMARGRGIWRSQTPVLVHLASEIFTEKERDADIQLQAKLACFRFLVLIAPELRREIARRAGGAR
ncbi:MAG: hypothetical protein IKO41_00490 [Lachnospiraceae bacterium]|nr:hypothetical protein [Lachnospiraceae bacterium]